MNQLTVKNKFAQKFRNGYPLIHKETVIDPSQLKREGTILVLHDEKGSFIGKGYYGNQNKGIGWLLTRQEHEQIDQSFFTKKIKTALQKRSDLFKQEATTAFRIFNGAGDGIGGLTIDDYSGYLVINWYSEGIYQFKDFVMAALKESTDYKGIYEKKRFDEGGKYIEADDFVAGERAEFPLIVKENGMSFATYLNEGAMTGIFLDQREVRKTIRDKYAKGKTVLNTFSYTGAFSVAAALGGAVKTTSVDLANRSLSKTIEQFQLNEIDDKAQNIIVEDVFHYFKYARKKELTFDLVILDPPSFARSKKFTFRAGKDYPNLLQEAIQITADQGVIVASTNCATFDMKKFKGFVAEAFKQSGFTYNIVEAFTLPADFNVIKEYKEGNYLKVLFLQKGGRL